jgi:hypothetical protein
MNSKDLLLAEFRDNQNGSISAASLRMFVDAVYREMLLVENILDRADIYDTDKVATINQVSKIKDILNQTDSVIEDYYKKSEVYTKSEVQAILNRDYYQKSETYNKAQIDAMFASMNP